MRTLLINAYLDFLNDYLTVARYAECNGLHLQQANDFIDLARKVYYSEHPES